MTSAPFFNFWYFAVFFSKFCVGGVFLTLRYPKQHDPQAPDVQDLEKTVKQWSDLFKIFTNVFAGA